MDTPTPPKSDAPPPEFEALLARLNRALRSIAPALRRRGLWIVFGALGGLLGGTVVAATTETPPPAKRFYKATTVMRLTGSGGAPSASNPVRWGLRQAQKVVASDAYRDAVASATGRSPKLIRNHLLSVAYQDTAILELTAVTADRAEAVSIATHAGEELQGALEKNMIEQSPAARSREMLRAIDVFTGLLNTDYEEAGPEKRIEIEKQLELLEGARRAVLSTRHEGLQIAPTFEMVRKPTAVAINSRAYINRWWAASTNVGIPNVRSSASLADVGAGNSDGDLTAQRLIAETKFPDPTKPPPVQPISLGLLAGLVMGLSGVVLGEAWDDRIRDTSHALRATGLQQISGIPHLTQKQVRAMLTGSRDDVPEAVDRALVRYREAATLLLAQMDVASRRAGAPDRGHRRAPIIVITSTTPAEGKTTTTAALARAIGDGGFDVLAVDGDYYRHGLRKALRPIPSFVGTGGPESTRHDHVDYLEDNDAHHAGPSSATAARLIRSVRGLADRYDVILIDSPPLLSTTDPIEYLQYADAAVLVVRIDVTVASSAQQAANTILRNHLVAPGIIVNGVPSTPFDRHSNDDG